MIYKAIFLLFSLAAITTMLVAIFVILQSQRLRYKPVWLIGSVFGFLGLGINWTIANDLYIQIGIQIPIIHFAYFPAENGIALKTLFPLVALVAILKGRATRQDDLEPFK